MADTPQHCLEGFYAALSRHDVAAARSFVFEEQPSDRVDAIYAEHPPVTVEMMTVVVEDREAWLDCRVRGVGDRGPGLAHSAYCVLADGDWRLSVDPKAPTSREYGFGDTIALFQGRDMALVMERAAESASIGVCLSNVRVIGSIAMTLAHERSLQLDADRDGSRGPVASAVFGLTPANWKEEIRSRLPELPPNARHDFFQCPNGGPISFNVHLCGVPLRSIPDPVHTILAYEGEGGRLNFCHDGRAHVALVGQSARAVGPEEAERLIWDPSA